MKYVNVYEHVTAPVDDWAPVMESLIAWGEANDWGLFFPKGEYSFSTGAGAVVDPSVHTAPEFVNRTIRIRGEGMGRTVFKAATADRRGPPSSSKMQTSVFKLTGCDVRIESLTIDGGMRVGDPIVTGTLSNGLGPRAHALLELQSCLDMYLYEVEMTGGGGPIPDQAMPGAIAAMTTCRRGPFFAYRCSGEVIRCRQSAPSFREGWFFGNCHDLKIEQWTYAGPSAIGQGHVSSPLHVYGPETRNIEVSHCQFSGAWSGSVFNGGFANDFVFADNTIIGGGYQGAQIYDGADSSDSFNTCYGRGVDFGDEMVNVFVNNGVPHPPSHRLTVRNNVIKDTTYYSFLVTRNVSHPLNNLVMEGNIFSGGWSGPALSCVLTGQISDNLFERFYAFDPAITRSGVGLHVDTGCRNIYCNDNVMDLRGSQEFSITRSAQHSSPNAVLVPAGPKTSRRGVWVRHADIMWDGLIIEALESAFFGEITAMVHHNIYTWEVKGHIRNSTAGSQSDPTKRMMFNSSKTRMPANIITRGLYYNYTPVSPGNVDATYNAMQALIY